MMIDRKLRSKLTEREIQKRLKRKDTPNQELVVDNKKEDIKVDEFGKTGIKIENRKNDLVITIPKSFIGKVNTFDLSNYLNFIVSPIFFHKKKQEIPEDYKSKKLEYSNMPRVGVFMNNVSHYSGGRYYAIIFCKFLAMIGCKVTIVTDIIPKYMNDFSIINEGGSVNFRCDSEESIWGLKYPKNEFDFVIGVPNMPGVRAFEYAKKWNIPIHMMVFETPNYVSQYRGGLDSGEGYWQEYKKCLYKCDKIICLAKVPMNEAINWLKEGNIDKSKFTFVYPAINTYLADLVKNEEEKNEITFIGRHVEFKNPSHVIKAVSLLKCEKPSINFVGAHSQNVRIFLSEMARKNNIKIRFYASVTDVEKYRIIKRSKLICIPSIFEGFGIVPAESLYCGKPVVVYDIPVIREVYGNYVEYANVGNINKLSDEISILLTDEAYRKKAGLEGQRHVSKICSPLSIKNVLREKVLGQKNLSISVGMIALNAEDTIEKSLKSVYNCAKQIIVVVGAVKDYALVNQDMVNISAKGHCIDNTVDILNNFNDPAGKIEIVYMSDNRFWYNKAEMQNEIAKRVTGDIYMKVDSDEIYKEHDIERIRNEFILDKDLAIFRYKFYHFWHNFNQYAVGGQWESKMTRCWRWNKGYRHSEGDPVGFNYFFDENDNKVDAPKYKVKEVDDRLVYHLNYAGQKSNKIQAKIKYYQNRGIEKNVRDTWTNWIEGNSTSPTHNGGTVALFKGTLPNVMTDDKFIKNGKINEKFDMTETMMKSPPREDIQEVVRVKSKVFWTVGMIVLNEERFIKKNIENLLRWNDLVRIVIVEGSDINYPKNNVTADGLSKDNTGNIINELVNKYDRILYVKKGFANCKQDLRNEYINNVIGSHLFVIDADEFYSHDDLNRLSHEVLASPNDIIQWEFQRDLIKDNIFGGIVHFWHSLKHRVVGGYYSIPHQRIYRIVDGMKYDTSHNHPSIYGKRYDEMRDRWSKTSITCYHAGFMKDLKNMRDKQNYYYNRGEKKDRPMYSNTRELWFNWDGKTMEYPEHKIKILDYNGFIPDVLMECANV